MSYDGVKRTTLERTTANNSGASKVGMDTYSGIAAGWLATWLKALVDRVDGKAAKVSGPTGTHTLATVTINSEGLVTSASSGSPGAVPDASTTVKGASKLSAAPTSATDPIAVGTQDAKVTADQAAGTASIRTLGTGAQQAAAGNHAHTRYLDSTFFYSGDVNAKTGVGHDPISPGGTVDKVFVMCDTAPAGGTVTATLVKEAGGPGGTSTTIGAVTLAIASRSGSTTGLSVALAEGDSVRLDVTTGGGYTTNSCKNLTAKARYSY